jgi:hypothetical protein
MGLLLYFLYDDSLKQRRTRQLTDGAVELFVRSLTLVRLPILRPVRKRVSSLLTDAGLVPDAESIALYQLANAATAAAPGAAGTSANANATNEEAR